MKKQKNFEKNSSFQNLEANFHAVPPGSLVIATPNAFMINETWCEIAPKFAKGIRCMPVIGTLIGKFV